VIEAKWLVKFKARCFKVLPVIRSEKCAFWMPCYWRSCCPYGEAADSVYYCAMTGRRLGVESREAG
jgi:hypothetical protein